MQKTLEEIQLEKDWADMMRPMRDKIAADPNCPYCGIVHTQGECIFTEALGMVTDKPYRVLDHKEEL